MYMASSLSRWSSSTLNTDLNCWVVCLAGARAAPNGAQSFWANAPPGSWQIDLPNAGHMSFLDYDPATDPGFAPCICHYYACICHYYACAITLPAKSSGCFVPLMKAPEVPQQRSCQPCCMLVQWPVMHWVVGTHNRRDGPEFSMHAVAGRV